MNTVAGTSGATARMTSLGQSQSTSATHASASTETYSVAPLASLQEEHPTASQHTTNQQPTNQEATERQATNQPVTRQLQPTVNTSVANNPPTDANQPNLASNTPTDVFDTNLAYHFDDLPPEGDPWQAIWSNEYGRYYYISERIRASVWSAASSPISSALGSSAVDTSDTHSAEEGAEDHVRV